MENQNHFVMFVSRDTERRDLEKKYPGAQFTWISGLPLPGAYTLSDAGIDRLAKRLRRRHDHHPFTGILNRREKFVTAAAELAEHLGLPRHVVRAFRVRDKLEMRRALDVLPGNPRCWAIDADRDFDAVRPQYYPLILKPRFGFNSRSIRLVRNRREAGRIWRRLPGQYARLKNEENAPDGFLIEEFVSGPEHTVEALVAKGRVIRVIVSDKFKVQPPFFTETGDIMPSTLSGAGLESVLSAARQAVAALGIINGWCHIEVKRAAIGPVVIEAAARMGGGYHGELIQQVYGFDRLKALMDLFADRPIEELASNRLYACGMRVVHTGVGWQLLRPKIQRLAGNAIVKFVWPRWPAKRPRLVLGPPLGFKNTVFEFIGVGMKAGPLHTRCWALARRYRGCIVPLPTVAVCAYHRCTGVREIDG